MKIDQPNIFKVHEQQTPNAIICFELAKKTFWTKNVLNLLTGGLVEKIKAINQLRWKENATIEFLFQCVIYLMNLN